MIKFKLNRKGVRNMLKWDSTAQECMHYAQKMQAAAGPGYEVEKREYPERIGASVFPETYEAYQDNLDNNTLEKVRRSV